VGGGGGGAEYPLIISGQVFSLSLRMLANGPTKMINFDWLLQKIWRNFTFSPRDIEHFLATTVYLMTVA
jgi:hypothetical protein